jgi:hypothetical protein
MLTNQAVKLTEERITKSETVGIENDMEEKGWLGGDRKLASLADRSQIVLIMPLC